MTGGLNTLADGTGTQIVPGGTTLVTSGSFDGPAVVLANPATDQLAVHWIGDGHEEYDPRGILRACEPLHVCHDGALPRGGGHHPGTGAFTATVTDADFQNTGSLQQIVPVPPSGLLVGLGLLLMGSARALRRLV